MIAEKDHFLEERVFEEIPRVIFVGTFGKDILNVKVGRILCEIFERIVQSAAEKIFELLTEGNFKQTPEIPLNSHRIFWKSLLRTDWLDSLRNLY